MMTVNISVPDSLARVYERASEDEKRKAQWLIELVLRDLFDDKPESLNDVVQDISQQAAERGITSEILDNR